MMYEYIKKREKLYFVELLYLIVKIIYYIIYIIYILNMNPKKLVKIVEEKIFKNKCVKVT